MKHSPSKASAAPAVKRTMVLFLLSMTEDDRRAKLNGKKTVEKGLLPQGIHDILTLTLDPGKAPKTKGL